MPFYGKPTLQRVYPSWTAARRSTMDRYIQVAYGKPFLAELKDKLNKKRLGKQKPLGKSVLGTQKNTRKSKEDQEIPSKTGYGQQRPSQSRLDNKEESSGTIKPLSKERNTAQVCRGKQTIEKKRIEQGEGSKSTPQSVTGYEQKKKSKKMRDTGDADINMTESKVEQAGECKLRYPIRTRLKKAVSKTASTDDGGNNNSATVAASTDASQDALPTNEAGIKQPKSGKKQKLNRRNQEVQVVAHSDTSCKEMPRKLKEDNATRKVAKKSERSGKQAYNTTVSGISAVKGRPQQKQSKMTLTSEGNFSGDKVAKKEVIDGKLRSKRKLYKPKKKIPYSKATTTEEIKACSDQLQPDRSSSTESNPKGDRFENKTCLSVEGGSASRDQQSKAANPPKQKHAPMFKKIEPLNMGLKPGTKKDRAFSHLVEDGFKESCGFKPAVSHATHPDQDRYPGKRGFSVEAGGVKLSQSEPQRSIHKYTQPAAEPESLYDERRSSESQEGNVPSASNGSLAGSSSFQGGSLTARKILGLRKTARKRCAPQSRHAKEKDVNEIVDVDSSPVSNRTVSPASFARRVSVDIVKLKESMECCPVAESTPVKIHSVVSGIVPNKKVSLPKRSRSSKRAQDEGKAESQGQVQVDAGHGFEGSDREKLMNPDYGTVTVANWEQNSVSEKSNWSNSQMSQGEPSMIGRPSQVGTAGALAAVGLISKTQASALQDDSSSGFVPEHNIVSRCSSASLAGSSSFQGSSFACQKISKTQASALQDDSSSDFRPEHNLVSRCSRCEEILSSKDSEGQLSEKKHNKDSNVKMGNKKVVGSFDKNLWDLAVVGDLADGPLLEDDESSTENDGTETPVSLYQENSQRFDEGGQELSRCSETRPLEEENYKDDSIVNESVEDATYTSPIDNVLPGLSRIHHNTAVENRSMCDKNHASPVIGVISCRKTDDPNDGSMKRNKPQSWDIIDDRLETADSCQRELSPDFNETSTASLECGHQNRNDATTTKKAELSEDEYGSQTPLPIVAIGNRCEVPQLHEQNTTESGLTSRQDGDVKEMTTSSLLLDSGIEDHPQIRKKIRTPAEKKQGWSEPDHSSLAKADEEKKNRPYSALYTDNGMYFGGKLLIQGTKKRRRSESGENRVRGHCGWEDCLRQKPSTVAKFQVGDAQIATKKSGSDQEKKRWQSPTKTTRPPALTTNALQQSPAKAFRQVWKPPPAKKLKLTDDADKQMVKKEETEKVSTNQQVTAACEPVPMQNKFRLCELIWGKMKGFNWWPGIVVHHYASGRDAAGSDACWVKWFGDGKYSKLSLSQVTSFAEFAAHFSQSTLLHTALYRRAVFEALELASTRAGKLYSMDPAEYKTDIPKRSRRPSPDWLKFYNLCNEMIEWAKEGFEPGGLKSILPTKEDEEPPAKPPSPPPSPVQTTPTKRAGRSPSTAAQWKDTRDVVMIEIHNGTRDIEDICIGCGSFAVTAQHPFFVGGLCEVCRIEFLEVAYVFDEDGYQAFCCICAEGNDIILCDQAECYRSFCHDCLEYLVGPGTVPKVLSQDHWTCSMCNPEPTTGLLSRRTDWPQKLQLFFQQDCNQDFPPLPTYPPVEMEQRKPMRVLSLFDGIGTGMLVLKELGIKVECYYASEISEEAIRVSTVRHDGVIQQLYDIKNITENEIDSLGPFDLMIGGSPCNDLSIANPSRKGLFEGTGRLFFDYYRLLNMVRPPVHSPRPFFWFFENVVGMPHNDKMDISRFLGCAPVVVDAKEVSPAHRARYFWGNIPGMNRPNVATNNNSLCLQDCLEPNCNRQAQFLKVRTVTSKLNSIKQKNEQILPVMMNGQADTLWCTEMERIFGFPEHYTDIANMSRTSRHKLIGQAWSVPVIKHLLAPLKEYFACETSQ